MDVSKEALDIMGRDPVEDHGFVHHLTQNSKEALAPGPNLDHLNHEMTSIINTSLSAICSAQQPKTVNMFEWVSDEVMLATTGALYCTMSPFKDAKVRKVY